MLLLLVFITLYAWWIVRWSFYDERPTDLKPFAMRSCVLFSGGLTGPQMGCCEAHSQAYWRGGTTTDKALADYAFSQCIAESGQPLPFISLLWHNVQTATATPYIHTSWRWGYGWHFGRGFREKSVE